MIQERVLLRCKNILLV